MADSAAGDANPSAGSSAAGHDEMADFMQEASREHVNRVWSRLSRLERIVGAVESDVRATETAGEHVVLPAWRRVTEGEARWPVSLAVIAAIGLELSLPNEDMVVSRWVLPAVAAALLVVLVASNPVRINRRSKAVRATSMTLIVVMSLSNALSAARLVDHLVQGTAHQDPARLLLTGAAVWLTNVIVFALWYWELDRAGPVERACNTMKHLDFLFPQMQVPEMVAPDWEPAFVDYLYLSFTNATAFSPTDVLPLSRWAKMTMMVQSAVSLVVVALVVARAVNILH